jgi:hypothetical protein
MTTIKQKYNETIPEYLKRIRETRNRCYNLTIREKDLIDLAFAGLSSYLREKMKGQDFIDVNQVLQRANIHENHAKDHRSYNRFKEVGAKEREKHDVNFIDENRRQE